MKFWNLLFLSVIFMCSCYKERTCNLPSIIASYPVKSGEVEIYDHANNSALTVFQSTEIQEYKANFGITDNYVFLLTLGDSSLRVGIGLEFDCTKLFRSSIGLDTSFSPENSINYSMAIDNERLGVDEGFYTEKEIRINGKEYTRVIRYTNPRIEDSLLVHQFYDPNRGWVYDTILTTLPARELAFCKEKGFLYLKDLESDTFILSNF